MLLPGVVTIACTSVIPCSSESSQTGNSLAAAPTQTIDRVVASVDGVAITLSDVEAEYRIERFLEQSRAPSTFRFSAPDAETLPQVLERVIDQKCLWEEARTEHTDLVASEQRAERTLAGIRDQFSSEEDFQALLRSAGLNEHDLRARIETQERILGLVDQRMRPLVSVGPEEIESYYRTAFLPEWAKKNKESAPALASVAPQIEEILVQRGIDQQLEVWLKELRAVHHVRLISSIASQ